MTTLANARALVLVLDAADALDLPEPRYCTLMDGDTPRLLQLQFATADQVRAWAETYEEPATTQLILGGNVESTGVSLVIYEVSVYCYAHQPVPHPEPTSAPA